MLTYLTPIDETLAAVDEAEWADRRRALCVRPLMENDALRHALGLGAAGSVTTASQAAKRVPTNTSAPAHRWRTKHAATSGARFDRRTLLESDR